MNLTFEQSVTICHALIPTVKKWTVVDLLYFFANNYAEKLLKNGGNCSKDKLIESITFPELREMMFCRYSISTLSSAVRLMHELELIIISRNPDRKCWSDNTNHYLFNEPFVRELITEHGGENNNIINQPKCINSQDSSIIHSNDFDVNNINIKEYSLEENIVVRAWLSHVIKLGKKIFSMSYVDGDGKSMKKLFMDKLRAKGILISSIEYSIKNNLSYVKEFYSESKKDINAKKSLQEHEDRKKQRAPQEIQIIFDAMLERKLVPLKELLK